jgi:hypothetical protein
MSTLNAEPEGFVKALPGEDSLAFVEQLCGEERIEPY